jgi:replicative DNA helicase
MESNISILEKGKLPPQAVDLEEAVLGSIMSDSKAIEEVVDILKAESFYKESHKMVFKAIKKLYDRREPIDLLTVSNTLRNSAELDLAGGDFALIGLTQKVSSSAHIEYHSRIIAQKALQRDLIKLGNSVIIDAHDDTKDVFALLNNTFDYLNEVSETTSKSTEVKISDLVKDQIEKGIKIFNGEIEAGLQTPFEKINKATGGWRDSELVIVAARPGMGKTAFILADCVFSAVVNKVPTAFFSLEMAATKLTDRVLSMQAKIDSSCFNINGLSQSDISKIMAIKKEIDEAPFYIDDTPSLSIHELRVKAKRMVSKYGIRKIVVDYLQLMSGTGGNREQEISSIARGLKLLAKELSVPVIALCQLSRAVETRGGSKRPLLSDLRESGAIEQDADVVSFIYRPEYYGIEEWDDDERSSAIGQAEVIFAKNRNGGLIRTRLAFEGRYTLFSDIKDDFEYFTPTEEEVPTPKASINEAFGDDNETPF